MPPHSSHQEKKTIKHDAFKNAGTGKTAEILEIFMFLAKKKNVKTHLGLTGPCYPVKH